VWKKYLGRNTTNKKEHIVFYRDQMLIHNLHWLLASPSGI